MKLQLLFTKELVKAFSWVSKRLVSGCSGRLHSIPAALCQDLLSCFRAFSLLILQLGTCSKILFTMAFSNYIGSPVCCLLCSLPLARKEVWTLLLALLQNRRTQSPESVFFTRQGWVFPQRESQVKALILPSVAWVKLHDAPVQTTEQPAPPGTAPLPHVPAEAQDCPVNPFVLSVTESVHMSYCLCRVLVCKVCEV